MASSRYVDYCPSSERAAARLLSGRCAPGQRPAAPARAGNPDPRDPRILRRPQQQLGRAHEQWRAGVRQAPGRRPRRGADPVPPRPGPAGGHLRRRHGRPALPAPARPRRGAPAAGLRMARARPGRQQPRRQGRVRRPLAYRCGRAIGALHRLPLIADRSAHPLPPTWALHALPLSLFSSARVAELHYWTLLQNDRPLITALEALREREKSVELRSCHGDLRLDQFLLHDDRLHVVDWEEARVADPARDVGAFAGEWLHHAIRKINSDVDKVYGPGVTLTRELILERGPRRSPRCGRWSRPSGRATATAASPWTRGWPNGPRRSRAGTCWIGCWPPRGCRPGCGRSIWPLRASAATRCSTPAGSSGRSDSRSEGRLGPVLPPPPLSL
ncbi:phosphotransferase [Nonomuraea thailandensis]